MKKIAVIIFLSALCLTACARTETHVPTEEFVQISNPWMEYSTLAEAETASDLEFPLPENVEDVYIAETILVMNGSLLEVRYRHTVLENEITVRMCAGEDQNISGVYDTFGTVTETTLSGAAVTMMQNETSALCLISADGYSYSLYSAGNQIPQAFLDYICSVE